MNKESQLNPESGITMIEVLLAAVVLTIGSLGAIGLLVSSIATDTRNKFDSTTTMLAQSIVEQIGSTAIGSGIAALTDCAGNVWTMDTQQGGAAVSGGKIDFSATPPANYHMDYVVKSPCTTTGIEQAVYDLRWNVERIGAAAGTPTNTYLLTVSARMKDRGQGNRNFALPVTLRVMMGN